MEELLNKGIKQIIDEYPEVGTILDSYDIGCTPCSLGTCKLKDVVDIHNVGPEAEHEMMTRIAQVVYPGQDIVIPLKERQAAPASAAVKFSPPMKRLVDEHVLIKRLIALVPTMVANLRLNEEAGRREVLDAVDFIRSYADRFHHAKEEDILFKFFDESIDIVQVMLDDHVTGRNHVKAVVTAVEARDESKAAEHLTAYAELLTQHIKKEDEILYPWMDRELTDRQIGEMFSQFNETDAGFGDTAAKYEKLISALEEQYR